MMGRIGGAGSLHLITSPIVTLDGDRAVARVMWTVINRAEEVPRSWAWWAITRTSSCVRPGAGASGVDGAW